MINVRSSHSPKSRSQNAEALVALLFEAHGWKVERSPECGRRRPDLIVQREAQRFAVEIKALAEGRADRVIPVLSQAILQAQAVASDADNAEPLAVVSVGNASQSLWKQVALFLDRYAPSAAVGLVSENGFRYFRGPKLEELNAEPDEPQWHTGAASNQPVNLFSDLNQWLLKVLLASEIPERLLQAPRQKYRSGSELADAADASAMSVSRFLQQLRKDGHLDGSSRYLVLVRRAELFRRWRSAAVRPSPDLPMKFLIRSPVDSQIQALLANQDGEACLGLFAAADALRLGHVSGVPPYIYVPKLPRPDDKKWRVLVPAQHSEIPDIIVRQAPWPKSVFRGAIQQGKVLVSDAIQIWLDVANHPSRGQEQADLIYENVLRPIVINDN